MVARFPLACVLLVAACAPKTALAEPHVVLMIGEREYATERTLPKWFADTMQPLGMRSSVITAPAEGPAKNDFVGLAPALEDADLLVISVRRRAPRAEQLAAVRRHLEAGKPLLAIRTASHAFDTRGSAPEGHAEWLKFDEQVLGAAYRGHYGDTPFAIQRMPAAQDHPILRGVRLWRSNKLYKSELRSEQATGLLEGGVGSDPPQPLAWTFAYGPRGARVFYTSLGLPSDFAEPGFQRLLKNATLWALERDIPPATDEEQTGGTRAGDQGRDAPIVLRHSEQEPTLRVADDLELDLLLREPIVANPLQLSFDERGRLWVVQYRQYPWPAGLKLLSRDNVWRNVYDPPFPPPPPHAPDSPFRGADRITIHTDVDGDGTFDDHRVFLDGLNFATAALVGRGGVFVMNPPYLLFYADRDRDDRPDSERPEILLSGFGIEDSHSIANSLRWGPDGWIYATQGSTVSASVVVHGPDGQPIADRPPVHSLGQNVWRYHPESRRYEVFAEGGGNAFGVEIDAKGRVYSGHNGGDTRGFYYAQGGYSQKNFGKHGQLSNPYAFAYYQPMRHHAVVRFTHTFVMNEAQGLPVRYEGRLFGVNPVEHHVVVSDIGPDGSSRKTSDLGLVIEAGEGDRANWFTPVDIQLSPDGSLYIADWYSVQPNHYRNHEGETNPDLGRVYRLRSPSLPIPQRVDLSQLSSEALVERYLFDPNRWYRQQTLRLLADRRDARLIPRLTELVRSQRGQAALESLWALHLCGGLGLQPLPQPDGRTDAMAPSDAQLSLLKELLHHDDPHVRRWTIRLVGDVSGPGDPSRVNRAALSLAPELLELATSEADVETRLQLAASARRFPAELGVPLTYALLDRREDATDVYLPNMIWWSLEAHSDHPELLLAGWQRSDRWDSPLRVDGYTIAQNLMRRFALPARQDDLRVCQSLLEMAPHQAARESLIEAFVASFAGRPLPVLPEELARQLAAAEGPFGLLLRVRQNAEGAVQEALVQITDAQRPQPERTELIRAVGDVRANPSETIPALLKLLDDATAPPLQNAALVSLQKFDQPDLAAELLSRYAQLPAETQAVARQVLASRAGWAATWLRHLQQDAPMRDRVEPEIVQRLQRHRQQDVRELLNELFPDSPTDNAAREAMIDAVEQVVRQGQGDPIRGRELFHGKAQCAKCHRLFARGDTIGPDLTSYNRTNLRRMLLAVVHPSAEVREGFEGFTAITSDGRVLAGLKIEQNDQLLVLRGTDGQDQTIPTTQLDELIQDERSLMPDGLLDELSEQELCDLFAYLTSTTPPL